MAAEDDEEFDDAELIAEIEREALKVKEALLANETLAALNDTVNNMNATLNDTNVNVNNNNNGKGAAQLTTFQDSVITTGSDVSILLMVILAILFIVQMIRKTYKHFTLQSMLQKVHNPLDDCKPMRAENLTPLNPEYTHQSYAVYNTEFQHRSLYMAKTKEGAPPSVLKDILLKRATQCVERARAMQRDGVGIRKNWNMDLLPRDVWDDFNAAQKNVQAEVECVVQENARLQFQWGPGHKNNVFSKAKEEYEKKMALQNKVFRQQMQQRQQQRKASNAPNAKSFGNGLNSGFFNNNNNDQQKGKGKAQNNKKLTKKEKQELRKQQKQMKRNGTGQPSMQENNIENPSANNNSQQTKPRRRKGKHRFGKS